MIYILYGIYIAVVLVILLNLLIAVMSETAISLSKQMENRARSLKLSSVSIVSRRLRAIQDIERYLCRRSENVSNYTIGGRTGEELNILEGLFFINEFQLE